jgi:hypothetical protein
MPHKTPSIPILESVIPTVTFICGLLNGFDTFKTGTARNFYQSVLPSRLDFATRKSFRNIKLIK